MDSLSSRYRPHLLRPRRRGIASVNSEVRDGIVPAADRIAQTLHMEDREPRGANYRTVALIIACAMFMENLDATVLATALPTMARDLGVKAPGMSVTLSCTRRRGLDTDALLFCHAVKGAVPCGAIQLVMAQGWAMSVSDH